MRKTLVMATHRALAACCMAGAATLMAAQEGTALGMSEDELFGTEETVVQAAETPEGAEAGDSLLRYDQVKVGGSLTGSVGFVSAWASAWDGSADPLNPDARYISPGLKGRITIVAKPREDFGVNMDFRTSWPFSSTTAAGDSVPNISVWALYSKFNWNDKVYFSFGKQPISWGVSKGAFQPADDIFALSPSVDLEDTGAEREGPVSLRTTVPLGVTNNLYVYAGLPSNEDGSLRLDPADARLAAKVEYGFGDTEVAFGAFYAYNDHPRALVMATTGLGSWNLYGEGVLKYGSERFFISEGALSASQESGRFYLSATAGGYYTNDEGDFTMAAAYLYNGEAQKEVSFTEAYIYYSSHPGNMDRMKFGEHYAFASLTKSNLLKDAAGDSRLSASLIAIADLSDLSGYVMPSLSWTFFDYMSLKLGATFTFGEEGDEYVTYGVGAGLGTKPGAALNLGLSIGSGSF